MKIEKLSKKTLAKPVSLYYNYQAHAKTGMFLCSRREISQRRVCLPAGKARNQEDEMADTQKIRIKLKAYEPALLDKAASDIVETAKRNGADVSGPIPLPTEKEIVTILRAVHKYKDSREQFEQRTHKRLIVLSHATPKTMDAMMNLDLAAGVDIEIKL